MNEEGRTDYASHEELDAGASRSLHCRFIAATIFHPVNLWSLLKQTVPPLDMFKLPESTYQSTWKNSNNDFSGFWGCLYTAYEQKNILLSEQ
jgi:hypothetical protein